MCVCVCERERERELVWRFGTPMSRAMKCCCVLCSHFGRASSGSVRLYIYIYIYIVHLSQHIAAYFSRRQRTSAYVYCSVMTLLEAAATGTSRNFKKVLRIQFLDARTPPFAQTVLILFLVLQKL